MARHRIKGISIAWSGLAVALLTPSLASAQLVVGNDATSGQLYVVDLVNPVNTRSLVGTPTTDFQVSGLAADNVNGILYWIDSGNRLFKAPIVSSGTLSQTLIGTNLNIGGATTTFNALAWDSTDNMLVAYKNSATNGSEGFYQVNTTDASCTLLHAVALTSDDYGGLDYDPTTDAFYGANDSTVTANRGIYRVNKPWASPTFTQLTTGYVGTDTDVDGLGFGNGRAYLVNDTASQGAFPYNIGTSAFETTIAPLPYSATGTNAGGAWAPGMVPPLVGADIGITKTDAPDPVVVPPGGNITYTITVTNHGPSPATDVAVADLLPGNVTFVSVDPPGIHSLGVITANIGNMAVNDVVAFNVVVTPNGLGTVTNTATVTASTSDPISSNNSATATTTVREPQANIAAAITPPTDCSVLVGGTASYTFALNNPGPEAAENCQMVVTFPANLTFVSSVPPIVPVGNTLTYNPGTIPALGSMSFSADFTVTAGPNALTSLVVSTTTSDTNPANNTADNTLNVGLAAPTSATIKAFLTGVAGSSTSDVAGLGGAKFTSAGLSRPFISPDGSRWIMEADTDIANTAQDEVIVVGTPSGSYVVAVQEGMALTEGDLVNTINANTSINNAGQYCFSADTDGTTNQDEVVVKWDGTNFVTVAREGNSCPALAGVTYGITLDGATIQADGTVSFYAGSLIGTPLGVNTDAAYFTDDGNTKLAQEGTDTPTNQGGGSTFLYGATFDTGAAEGTGLHLNAAGTSFTGIINLGTAPTTADRALVVDNDVKIQEGFVVPGSAYTSVVASASPLMNAMMADGTWFSYGSNADGQDWVVRNGTIIAETNGELTPGSGLFWGDASYAQTYFIAAGNANGDYIVGGVFHGGDAYGDSNAAIVLNGTTIIARENDPVDLDGNGEFDDGFYIRTFRDDRVAMSNDAVYCIVTLRDAAEALCPLDTPNTDRGSALIKIPLPGGNPVTPGDVNCDGQINGKDIQAFVVAVTTPGTYAAAYPGCNILNADTNNSSAADAADIPSFLSLLVP